MARVDIPQPRASITETPTGLLITIPANRNWVRCPGLLDSGMCGWFVRECSVIIMLARAKTPLPANLFMLAWLGAWTVGGAFAGYLWLWNVAGKELIALRIDTLAIKSDVLGFGRVREFDLAEVRDLRVDRPSPGFTMFNQNSPAQMFGTERSLSITARRRFASRWAWTNPRRGRLSPDSTRGIPSNRRQQSSRASSGVEFLVSEQQVF